MNLRGSDRGSGILLFHSGYTFSLADTSEFNGSRSSDEEIVDGIIQWLEKSAAVGTNLPVFSIYIELLIQGLLVPLAQNLRMFKRLSGSNRLG